MDNFRLGEVASEIDNLRLSKRVEQLEHMMLQRNDNVLLRLEKLEERLNLMMNLKTANKLDITKFTCEIMPLGSHLRKSEVESKLRKVEVDS